MNLREKLSHFFVTGKSLGTAQTFSDLSPQADDTQTTLLAKQLALRRRITGTALASAARTSTTQSSDIEVGSASGIGVYLNVTAITGTGVRINLLHKDHLSGVYVNMASPISATTATGLRIQCFGIGFSAPSGISLTSGCGTLGVLLPETVRIEITHTDGNSVTYSVSYVLR